MRKLIPLLALLGLAALAAVVASSRRSATSPQAEATAPAAVPEPPPSSAAVYEFHLTHDGRAEVLGGGAEAPSVWVETVIALRGRLGMWPMPDEEGRRVVQVGLLELEEHAFEVNGQAVFPTRALVEEHLLAPRAVVVLEAGGRPVELRLPQGAEPPFERVLQLIMGELQYSLAPTEEWQAEELAAFGRAQAEYRARSSGARRTIDKVRRYREARALAQREQLSPPEGSSEATLELEGQQLVRFIGRESLGVSRQGAQVLVWRLELEATRVDAAAPPAWASARFVDARRFGDVRVSERAEAQHLAQRIQDMTPEKMAADLAAHGPTGEMPDHNAWAWKVTGLLRRDPGLIATLTREFERPDYQASGRAFVVDLLAGTGTAEAQEALLGLLRARGRGSDAEWRQNLQALGRISTPTRATLDYAVEQYRSGLGIDRWAAALAVGAVVHNMTSDPAAQAAGDLLWRDFAAASDRDARVKLLGAIGNAGLESHVGPLLALGADPDTEVRRHVAYAMRRHDTPEARALLVTLGADPKSTVAISALKTLGRLTVTDAELEGLRAHVAANRIPSDAFPTLVSALTTQRRHPMVQEMLRSVMAHPNTPPRLAARCRGLLE